MVGINNKTRSKIDLSLVRKAAERFLKVYKKKDSEASIVFVGDAVIRKLNKQYRKIDKVTDVLAFPATVGASPQKSKDLGEIIIDYAQVKRNARVYKNSVRQELIFILIHGLLHLLGHNDATEKGRIKMEKIGVEFVKNL